MSDYRLDNRGSIMSDYRLDNRGSIMSDYRLDNRGSIMSDYRLDNRGSIMSDYRLDNRCSIMSDYRLDNRGSIAGRGKEFFPLASAQTSFEAHPVSYPIGTGGPFPGVKSGRVVMLITQAHLLPRRMSRSYNPLPLSAYRAINGATSLYFTLLILLKSYFHANCYRSKTLHLIIMKTNILIGKYH
jgi:hypothetical protein